MKKKFLAGFGIFLILIIPSMQEVFSQVLPSESLDPQKSNQLVSLTVIKEIDGGSADPNDFILLVNEDPVNSGEVTWHIRGTTLSIGETPQPDYFFYGITGDGCPTSLDEEFTITQNMVCTVNNGFYSAYIPPTPPPEPELFSFPESEPMLVPTNIPKNSNYKMVSEKCKKFPKVYHLGINTDRISNIDLKEGTFDAQFWVWVYPNNQLGVDFEKVRPPIDYVNSQNHKTSKTEVQPNYYVTKVEGTFFTDFDFADYPFERISLPIIIEPFAEGICETFFVIDDRPYENFAIKQFTEKIGGYKIMKTDISEGIKHYEVFEDPDKSGPDKYGASNFSRIISTIDLEKPPIPTFFQFIFPIFLLSFLAILVFFLPIDTFQKIELSAIFLVSMVFYSQLVKFETSFISDFTLFDTVVAISYGIFLITILIPGYQIFRKKGLRNK